VIWQNPWAWLGIVTLAVPVLIHLLGRGHARVLPFPSLRFLERSRLLPTRRTRVHDLLLLLVRLGVLFAAVVALAQPLLRTTGQTRAVSQTLARAVVVDTSASMQRSTPSGETAHRAARRDAVSAASDANTSVVLETRRPATAIAGAVEWLERQPGQRELVVISDFQDGALNAADLASVPASIGVRMVRIGVSTTVAPAQTLSRAARGLSLARVTTTPEQTDVVWSTTADTSIAETVLLLTGPADGVRAQAAARAAATLGARLPFDATRRIAIVFPSYEPRAELLRSATAVHVPWMTSVAAQLRADSLLMVAASSRPLITDTIPVDSLGLVIARDAARRAVVVAKQATVQGRERLLLVADVDPGSLVSAALIAAVDRARSAAPLLDEFDSATIPDETLAAWQRPASSRSRDAGSSGASDGRWFWVAALVLLAIETWMRRTKRETTVPEVRHGRAA
jgi:Aerotolerance regulator N-terminal